MTELEAYHTFLAAKGLKPHTPIQPVLDAAAPFVARGLAPDMAHLPTPTDHTIATDLINRAVEKAAAVKAGLGNRPNTEGTYTADGYNLWREFIARIVMQPVAMPPLERIYSLICQYAREDRHEAAMDILRTWSTAPAPKDTIDADAVAALADQIKRKVGR